MCQEQNPRHFKKCDCSNFDSGDYYFGLGATGVQTAISAGGAGAGVVTGALIGSSLLPGVGTAIGAGIGIAASAISSLFTPNYMKIYATNDVNAIAAQMETNLKGWQSLPTNSKVPAVQQFFITNYNNLWANLVAACGQASLGTAGQNCITQREPNGLYPFASYYLDPIQNDPNVITQTVSVTFQDPLTGTNITVNPDASSVSSLVSSVGSDVSSVLSSGTSGYVELGLAALVLILILK